MKGLSHEGFAYIPHGATGRIPRALHPCRWITMYSRSLLFTCLAATLTLTACSKSTPAPAIGANAVAAPITGAIASASSTAPALRPPPIPAPPQVQARGYVLIDFASG